MQFKFYLTVYKVRKLYWLMTFIQTGEINAIYNSKIKFRRLDFDATTKNKTGNEPSN